MDAPVESSVTRQRHIIPMPVRTSRDSLCLSFYVLCCGHCQSWTFDHYKQGKYKASKRAVLRTISLVDNDIGLLATIIRNGMLGRRGGEGVK